MYTYTINLEFSLVFTNLETLTEDVIYETKLSLSVLKRCWNYYAFHLLWKFATPRQNHDQVLPEIISTAHIKSLRLRKSLPQMLPAPIVIRSESGALITTLIHLEGGPSL